MIYTSAALLLFIVVLPACGAEGTKNGIGMPGCLECHYRLPLEAKALSFHEEIEGVCRRCHEQFHGKDGGITHPLRVIPSMTVPKDMPLDVAGRLSCITCHSFHIGHNDRAGSNEHFLRRVRGKTFCYSCHKKPLF